MQCIPQEIRLRKEFRGNGQLRPRKQCIGARNRAIWVLGFIARSVKSKNAEFILKLYLALVRPHLDYTMQFWSHIIGSTKDC